MFPEICRIGPFTVYSYGFMLVAAFLVGVYLASCQAQKEGLGKDLVFNLCFASFICGILGARIFYIAENLSYYVQNPLETIMLQHGGLAWFGGLLSGLAAAALYLRGKRLPAYKVLDIIVPFLALAQAIGRIGCLLNGCCFGRPSEAGLYFAVHGATLVPTQVYSTLLLLAIFIILRLFQDAPHKSGQIFYTYLLLYSLKRFFIEFWRADNRLIFSGLTLFQLMSIAIFAVSIIKLFLIAKRKE